MTGSSHTHARATFHLLLSPVLDPLVLTLFFSFGPSDSLLSFQTWEGGSAAKQST